LRKVRLSAFMFTSSVLRIFFLIISSLLRGQFDEKSTLHQAIHR
jgi:hypothetical protein